MRIRIFLYVITGCCFGIVSWYASFLNDDIEMLLRFLPFASLASLLLILAGTWFLPAIFVASIEVRHAKDLWRPALAVACLWTTMVVSYYVYYAILIAVTGAGQLSFLRIVNATNPNVWEDWRQFFTRTVMPNIAEWLPASIIGGATFGGFIGLLYRRLSIYQSK
ncbi:MAG: hypothetical protein AAGF95_10530, partial [Chloroflexota bacterium]